jgi:hypothetical protein
MFTVGVFSMLAGVVLGMHFRVFILFPAVTLTCAVIAVFGVVGHDALWWPAIVMLVAAAALQTGYLLGATRAPSRPAPAPGGFAPRLEPAARSSMHAIIPD